MKKVLSLILCGLMLLSAMPVSADPIWDAIMNIPRNEAPDVYLNSVELSFDNDAFPQNVNGRVLVPFRAVLEAYDAEVLYDEETKEITATRGAVTVSFRNGDYNMTVIENGIESTVTMDVCPTLNTEYNRTMVPIRFLSEAFGLSVGWTGEDVIVADFRGLLAQVVEENALLTAIRETRAENPEGFTVEKIGKDVYQRTSPKGVPITSTVTWRAVGNVTTEGDAYVKTKFTESEFTGEDAFQEDTSEIRLDGMRYEKKDVYQDKEYQETPILYTDGETFLQNLAIDVLLSAKSFDACMDDALLILENTQTEPDHYEKIKNGLLVANELFAEESVVIENGNLNFLLTPEEYHSRRYQYYEENGMSQEELGQLKETLDTMTISYSLQATFSDKGEVVDLVLKSSKTIIAPENMDIGGTKLEWNKEETCTRLSEPPVSLEEFFAQ